MVHTVKAVADFAGISIRTLHHYDDIGLLKPAGTSPSGYRLYSNSDLERLQEILFFKELGFGLQEIKDIMDSPSYDRKQALHSHKRILIEKKKRLEDLIGLVEKTLTTMERKIGMKNEEMFDGFDDAKIEEYKREARERWGHSEAFMESERRTAKYTKADWDEIKAESGDIITKLAALMDEGKSPADDEVQEQIERWFKHINDRFYACTPEVFRGLGDMYVADKRFTEFYDKVRPGLAEFKRDAMHAYCDKLGG
ncbi:MAG TPA: MerR family transcriptional regulator [Anaerolineae bacterium]|nr:MerR family transcriptional regulator [Anaerolineae bacterium]